MAGIKNTVIINEAKKHIGYKAKANQENKFTQDLGIDYGRDWCCDFVTDIFKRCYALSLLPVQTGGCGIFANAFRLKKKLTTDMKKAKPGMPILYHWTNADSEDCPGYKIMDHVGIIYSIDYENKTVKSIEGNTAYSDDAPGGMVALQTRTFSQVSAICLVDLVFDPAFDNTTYKCKLRVAYKGNKNNRKGQVMTIQRSMNQLKGGQGYRGKDGKKFTTINGVFDTNLEYAVNSFMKAHPNECGPADGWVGVKCWKQLLSADAATLSINTVTVTMRKLAKGNTFNRKGQVQLVQIILRELNDRKGYKGKDGKQLSVNGVFDANVEYALKTFQKAHNLPQTGVMDAATWKQLLSFDSVK